VKKGPRRPLFHCRCTGESASPDPSSTSSR
jgi:hypothetical protein